MKKQMAFAMAICLVGSAIVFANGGSEQKTVKLRASTNLAPTGTVGQALKMFTQLVNEKSGGKIVATANFGSELGNQREQVEMCKSGSLEMVVAAPGSGPGAWVPQLQAFEFPYLFNDEAHYQRVLLAMEPEVSKLVAPYNFIAVGGQNMGFRHMLIKPRGIKTPEDMKGLKMRGPNPIYISMFQSLGAAGTTTDWNEVYNALQTGVIDGMEASPDMIASMKFNEVAPYMSKTGHIAACVYYFFNKSWYEKLPADLQKIVMDSAHEAAAYQNKIDSAAQKTALEKMIAGGLKVNEVADVQAFRNKTAPMLDAYKAKGPEWADFINKLSAVK